MQIVRWSKPSYIISCLVIGLNSLATVSFGQPEQPQSPGRTLSASSTPVSETFEGMRNRDKEKASKRQDDIRRGLRPAKPVLRIQPEEEEHDEQETILPGTIDSAATAPLTVARFKLSQLPDAPVLSPQALASAGFKGDDMLEGSDLSGFLFIPPDTQGAIGPDHFLEMTNATASVYTRTGTRVTSASLDSFFTITVGATTYPRNGSTDPRILYDRRSGRWFTCIIEIGASSSGAANNIIMAISRTSNPATSIWDKYIIPTAQGNASGNTKFNDYESLGIDDNGVYFGMRVFSKSGQSVARIVVTPKAPLVAASPSLGAITDFDNIADMYSTPQPGNNFDAVAANGRAWFVASNHQVYGNMNYRRLTWAAGTPTLDAASTVLTTPAFSAPIDPPSLNAAQSADSGDMRMMMAVIRNNRLWCCRHVGVNSAGAATTADRTACEFIELNVSTATPSIVQTGRVFDPAATTPRFYYYPAVAVNGQGHVLMSMSGSKSTEFIGAYIAGRYASDPIGTMGTPTLYKAGEAKYDVSFSGSPVRWGDYSFTSLDPADDMSMWAMQEYARTPDGTQDLWSTWIAKALSAAPTLNNPAATGAQGASNYNLALTGTGIYDPGTGFPNRLAVTLNGGATNGISGYNVVYNSPTSANVIFSIAANASPGTRDIVLTNPDGQAATAVGGFTVTASVPNTAPTITVPSAQSGSEDVVLPITGISISDVDAGSGNLATTVTVTNGILALNSTTGLIFTSGADNTAAMTFTGTLANTNAALSTLNFAGTLNYAGPALLSIATTDQGNTGTGGALGDSKSLSITLAAVNDAPVVSVPGAQSVLHDTNLPISGTVISDLDLGANEIQVTLSALNGKLTLASVSGLTFTTGDGTSDATMTFAGTPASVNSAVATITYLGNTNYSGPDTISVTANDQGFTGSGGAKSHVKTIAINVAVPVGFTELTAE